MDTRDWHIQLGVPPKYDVSILAVILATTPKYDVSILVVILATTPNWLWSARIHNAIAVAMSICVAVATRLWILQSASAYKTA